MSDIKNPCSALGIPERLHTGDREADSHFEENEQVYRRFWLPGPKETWSMIGNSPSARIFDLSEDSYNRSKYCDQPEDVLFNVSQESDGEHYANAGIMALQVSHIRDDTTEFTITENGNERRFTFSVEHDPLPCMYPHTNVNVLENGKLAPKRPQSLKLAFRLMLRDYLSIVKPYNIDNP